MTILQFHFSMEKANKQQHLLWQWLYQWYISFNPLHEDDQKDKDWIEARWKKAFADGVFTAYKKLFVVRWPGEQKDICMNRIRQLVRLAKFMWADLEWLMKLTFIIEIVDAKHWDPDYREPNSESKSTDDNWELKPTCSHSHTLIP